MTSPEPLPLVKYLNTVCLICKKIHQGPCSDQDLANLLEGFPEGELPFPFEGDV